MFVGATPRWRAGVVPAEVLHNMFGLINQIRHSSQRTPRLGGSARTRPTSRPNATGNATTGTENTSASNNNTSTATNGESNQSPNNATERSIELDITGTVGGKERRQG